jgi:hypothetical protein
MESQDGNSKAMENSDAQTYHCLCSQLILSSNKPISQYSKRAGEGLDKAYILPLLSPFGDSDGHGDPTLQTIERQGSLSAALRTTDGVALLLNAPLDSKPIIIRREDGFEKRYIQRCSRCRLIVGYQLDKSQYDGYKSTGRREDVLYILSGALMSTEEMTRGKDMAGDIVFKGVSSISSKS